MAMHVAQDTFAAELEDGTPVTVAKGGLLHESHELVKRDIAGAGVLFRPLDTGDEPPPKKPGKAAAGEGA